jgi:hypothetical protein
MFFEPWPAGERRARGLPELPPWSVEWPFGGIELTMAEFDGAAILAAAGLSGYCWPDSGAGQ